MPNYDELAEAWRLMSYCIREEAWGAIDITADELMALGLKSGDAITSEELEQAATRLPKPDRTNAYSLRKELELMAEYAEGAIYVEPVRA